MVIDLAGLEYSLEFSNLQAAGLFAGQQCEGCEFPAEASLVMLNERVEGKVRAAMFRQGDHLHFTFYDEDAAAGPARIEAVRDVLRAVPGGDKLHAGDRLHALLREGQVVHGRRLEVAAGAGPHRYQP